MGGAAIVEIIFGLPGHRLHADPGDLRPRLSRHPGGDADARVHLHLRQPARRPPLRRARPEDLAGMSQFGELRRPGARARRAERGRHGAWVYAPLRRPARFAKWRNPIGIVGRRDRQLQRPDRRSSARSSGRSTPTSSLRPGCRTRAGPTRWEPTSSAATRWRGSSTAPRSRCRWG